MTRDIERHLEERSVSLRELRERIQTLEIYFLMFGELATLDARTSTLVYGTHTDERITAVLFTPLLQGEPGAPCLPI